MTARHVVSLSVVLLAVLAAGLTGRAPWAPGAGVLEPFPRSVVASPAPAPLVHVDRPDVRVLQLLASLDGMWAAAFDDAGDEYERPRVRTAAGEGVEECGAERRGWAGVYCPLAGEIVIDLGDHAVVRAGAGDERADEMLGYVLAHEVGHHVQTLRGAPRGRDLATVRRRELHAECLAGVWGRAAGRALPPERAHVGDAEHGTAAEQHRWLSIGHRSGRPADCDAVWVASGAA